MRWKSVEKASLAASAGLLFGCTAIGFKWVASPYLKGYASAAAGLFVLSRLVAELDERVRPAPRNEATATLA